MQKAYFLLLGCATFLLTACGHPSSSDIQQIKEAYPECSSAFLEMLSSLKTYELCKQSTATDCEEKAILSPEIEDMLFVQKQCGDFVEKIDMHYMRKICDKEWESSRTKDSTKLIDCYLNYLAF